MGKFHFSPVLVQFQYCSTPVEDRFCPTFPESRFGPVLVRFVASFSPVLAHNWTKTGTKLGLKLEHACTKTGSLLDWILTKNELSLD